MPELIAALRAAGLKTAVVSNKVDFAVQTLAEDYFKGLFDMAVGGAGGVRRKPAPDSVNEVMRTLGIPQEKTVYIGDSDVDADTARNAGVDLSGWNGASVPAKCCWSTARPSPSRPRTNSAVQCWVDECLA